jgi:HK97 family phage major capsid protein
MGITLTPGINTTATASINVTNALAMLYTLEVDNAAFGALGFLMHPRVWNTSRGRYRTKHTEYQGIVQNGPTAAIMPQIAGYPVYRSTQVRADTSSTSDVYFGNWNDLIIGRWGGISFDVTTEASDGTNHAFMQNQFWVRAIAEVDVAVRRAESFCVNDDVTD